MNVHCPVVTVRAHVRKCKFICLDGLCSRIPMPFINQILYCGPLTPLAIDNCIGLSESEEKEEK